MFQLSLSFWALLLFSADRPAAAVVASTSIIPISVLIKRVMAGSFHDINGGRVAVPVYHPGDEVHLRYRKDTNLL
jgi:hypothetical protein